VRSTHRELGDAAIHPNACMLFSESQYRSRRGSRGSLTGRVGVPFDSQAIVDWSPVWSLTAGSWRYLPTML